MLAVGLRLTGSVSLVWCSNNLEIMIQSVVCLNPCKGAPPNILFPAVGNVNMHKIQTLHKRVPSFALLNYSLFSKVFIISCLNSNFLNSNLGNFQCTTLTSESHTFRSYLRPVEGSEFELCALGVAVLLLNENDRC